MRSALAAFLLILAVSSSGFTGDGSPADFRPVIRDLAQRCGEAKAFMFEGQMQIQGKRGDSPGRLLSVAKIKVAKSPGGKSFLQMEPVDKDAYLLVSDGQKSWAYVPKLKQYTEREAAAVLDDEEDPGEGGDDERDLSERFVWLLMPKLARLYDTASSIVGAGEAQVKYADKKQTWPVVRVFSKKDEREGQDLAELTLDPATLAIGRMMWANVSGSGAEKTLIRITIDFDSFRTGETVADSMFVFEPPKKAKLAEVLPIPGQTGSFLLNQPAPDFELKSLAGERVHLADLRDRTVLLNFWASWCGPCRRELPGLNKVVEEYKGKGLVVLGVNDEGKGTAKEYSERAKLLFDTLDDGSRKVHRMYRVNAIPSVFVIDRQGKIVRFLQGAHDAADLRAALKAAGVE